MRKNPNYNANVISKILNRIDVNIEGKMLPEQISEDVSDRVHVAPFDFPPDKKEVTIRMEITNSIKDHVCSGRWYTDTIQANPNAMIDWGLEIFVGLDKGTPVYYLNGSAVSWTVLTNRIDRVFSFTPEHKSTTRISTSDNVPKGEVKKVLKFLRSYDQENFLLLDMLECWSSPELEKEAKEMEKIYAEERRMEALETAKKFSSYFGIPTPKSAEEIRFDIYDRPAERMVELRAQFKLPLHNATALAEQLDLKKTDKQTSANDSKCVIDWTRVYVDWWTLPAPEKQLMLETRFSGNDNVDKKLKAKTVLIWFDGYAYLYKNGEY